jgi:hypothetical protein
MDTKQLTSARFDAWASAFGPARLLLLAPLRERLLAGSPPPQNYELVIEPMRWLLDQIAAGKVPLTNTGLLKARFSEPANHDLGFDTVTRLPNGERSHIEMDALHAICRNAGFSVRHGKREQITPYGDTLRGDPLELWIRCAEEVGHLPDVVGVVAETRLATLLQYGDIETEELERRCNEALFESLEFTDPELEAEALQYLQECVYCVKIVGRALSMWDDPRAAFPVLGDEGLATVVYAFRSAALALPERIACAAWN